MPSLNVSVSDLSRAVEASKNVVASRNTIPILECAVLLAEAGTVRVAVTDNNCGLAMSIPGEGSASWALDLRKLEAFVKACPSSGVIAMTGDDVVSLRCGKTVARIPSLAVADFPDWMGQAPAHGECTFNNGKRFADTLRRIALNCMDRPGVLMTQGVHLRIDGKAGAARATSGYQMATATFDTDAPIVFEAAIPQKQAIMIGSLFDGVDGLSISDKGGLVWVCGPGVEFCTRKLDAEVPEAFLLYAATDDASVSVDTASLVKAVQGVEAMTDKNLRSVVFNVNSHGAFLASQDGSGAIICIPFECDAGADVQFVLNSSYLKSLVASSGLETLHFRAASGTLGNRHLQCSGDGFVGALFPQREKAGLIDAAIKAYTSTDGQHDLARAA